MKRKIFEYPGEKITVSYDAARCIHAGECVRGIPGAFDPQRKPWIAPDAADAGEMAEVIERCPSGALSYARLDGVGSERPPESNTVRLEVDGPLRATGDLDVLGSAGERIHSDTRLTLCRCGLSRNKPFCDNSHRNGFSDAGELGKGGFKKLEDWEKTGPVKITVADNGPLIFDGPVEIVDASCENRRSGGKTALCRCGVSANKPFCDGTHRVSGFRGD
jgi:uncharacterized Fe-S cluster protein YjdI/CDGSH-type Zn-finger protein